MGLEKEVGELPVDSSQRFSGGGLMGRGDGTAGLGLVWGTLGVLSLVESSRLGETRRYDTGPLNASPVGWERVLKPGPLEAGS
jgi:hypothetical protein